MKDTGIRYEKEFACKRFEGKNQKDAYMRGMKWYATNILARNELHKVQFSVEKVEPNAILLHMYIAIDESDVRKQQCSICKEMHHKFYLNKSCNCSRCSVNAYYKRMEDTIRTAYYWCQEKVGPYL